MYAVNVGSSKLPIIVAWLVSKDKLCCLLAVATFVVSDGETCDGVVVTSNFLVGTFVLPVKRPLLYSFMTDYWLCWSGLHADVQQGRLAHKSQVQHSGSTTQSFRCPSAFTSPTALCKLYSVEYLVTFLEQHASSCSPRYWTRGCDNVYQVFLPDGYHKARHLYLRTAAEFQRIGSLQFQDCSIVRYSSQNLICPKTPKWYSSPSISSNACTRVQTYTSEKKKIHTLNSSTLAAQIYSLIKKEAYHTHNKQRQPTSKEEQLS